MSSMIMPMKTRKTLIISRMTYLFSETAVKRPRISVGRFSIVRIWPRAMVITHITITTPVERALSMRTSFMPLSVVPL